MVISDRGTGYAPGDTGTIDAPAGGLVGVAATYVIKAIDDVDYTGSSWTLEVIDPSIPGSGDAFFEQGDSWVNPNILSSKTDVAVSSILADTPAVGQYTITLSLSLIHI